MPASFHPYPHRLPRPATVELLRFPVVLQATLTALSCLCVHKCDLLKPRVIIAAYNPHVGSSSRALVLFSDSQCTRRGADLRHESTEGQGLKPSDNPASSARLKAVP